MVAFLDLRILKDLAREIVELRILKNLAAPESCVAEGGTPTPGQFAWLSKQRPY
jgi:hypothetical protein